MSRTLAYKGFEASVEDGAESSTSCGSILNIDDGVYFEAESASDIEIAFHEAVDDYIAFCAEKGKEPSRT